jgi:hypothetical protein
MKKLFTERFGLTQPRVKEQLDANTAAGILAVIQARIDEEWLGESFPAECEDGGSNAGCDISKLKGGLAAYNVIWPGDWPNRDDEDPRFPDDPQIFDLIEFILEHVSLPEPLRCTPIPVQHLC